MTPKQTYDHEYTVGYASWQHCDVGVSYKEAADAGYGMGYISGMSAAAQDNCHSERLVPIVASEAAWDCFFDREVYRLANGRAVTRCGWHTLTLDSGGYRSLLTAIIIYQADAEWIAAAQDVLAEITALTGIEFMYPGVIPCTEAVCVVLEPGALLPDGERGMAWKMWTGKDSAGYVVSGFVSIAADCCPSEELKRYLLRHELLHELFGFYHAETGVMSGDAYLEFTEQDKEMLRLYGALSPGLAHAEIAELACIGADGVCERMYDSS